MPFLNPRVKILELVDRPNTGMQLSDPSAKEEFALSCSGAPRPFCDRYAVDLKR